MSRTHSLIHQFTPCTSNPLKTSSKPSPPPRVSFSAVHSEIKPASTSLSARTPQIPIRIPAVEPPVLPSVNFDSLLEVDKVTESELKENGFRSTRRTKFVCTIGPSTCGIDELETLAVGGMNVARVNMCHNSREWHKMVFERVRRLNADKGFAVAVMMDIQGSETHMGDLDGGASSAKAEDGEVWTFSVRSFDSSRPDRTINVNYEGFAEDVKIGDEVLVDGGMVRFQVIEKVGPDVRCICTDSGLLLPRANLAIWRNGSLVQERNGMLPTITSKDWEDIDFGIAEGVDFIALSFVKTAEPINQLKRYIATRSSLRSIAVIAKIESVDSIKNLEEIIQASDGAVVARGDMGAQIPLEQVPFAQERIVSLCRQFNKPVIVASQLLESMIEYPTPTRAEVADVSNAVKQQADALMLSGETAMGMNPEKALAVLRSVSLRIEKWQRGQHRESVAVPYSSTPLSDDISAEICISAASMANRLQADALFVYTTNGHMASLLSRCRPDCPIFAFTTTSSVRRSLNLQWGLIPFRLNFSDNISNNLSRTFSLLKVRGMIKPGDLVVAISDVLQSVQVMSVP